jgi:hypothetical protein
MNELRNRGVEDILIAAVDGLKGFPEAITAVFVPAPGRLPAGILRFFAVHTPPHPVGDPI